MRADIIPRHMSTGRALWGTHAVWATLLEDWERFNGSAETPEAWSGIEFDKLAHLAHLVWNALHARDKTSFASVYDSAHGLHGPGPALPKRGTARQHIHAVDALNHIQSVLGENPDVHLFDIRARQYEGKTQYTVRAGRERTYLPVHLSSNLRPGWSEADKGTVQLLSAFVRKLGKDEIRAFGTHQNKTRTIEAIEYNVFVHLFRRLVEETETIENRGVPARSRERFDKSDLPSLGFVVQEIGRKAFGNRRPFTTAYDKVAVAAREGNQVAQIAIDGVFDHPDEIWVTEVTAWQRGGALMERVHDYARALRSAFVVSHQGVGDSAQELEARGLAARSDISRICGIDLPMILPHTQVGAYPWRDLRRAIVGIFDTLPHTTRFSQEVYPSAAQRFR
jgi:hypothetical protein